MTTPVARLQDAEVCVLDMPFASIRSQLTRSPVLWQSIALELATQACGFDVRKRARFPHTVQDQEMPMSRTTDGLIAGACASGLFVVLVAIGLAGADWPPPPGFALLEVGLATVSEGAYVRIKTHLAASTLGNVWVSLRVVAEGATAGVAVMGVLTLLGSGEPGIVVSTASRMTGVGVAAIVGATPALLTWLLAKQLQSHLGSRR